jgi:predicted GIY-YIG superfamily endonuclease
MTGVYLLHFSTPYKHAKHYIGWAKMIDKRIQHHQHGTGARLTAVVSEAGIELIKARVWEGKGKDFERKLKNQHKPQSFCPICNPETASQNMKG